MRATVTLETDVEALVRRVMRERGLSFEEAVNEAIRAGLRHDRAGGRALLPTFDMGEPLIEPTKALRLAGELEDRELADRLGCGA